MGGDRYIESGLLMRADLHALFDADLLNIDPKSVILLMRISNTPECNLECSFECNTE